MPEKNNAFDVQDKCANESHRLVETMTNVLDGINVMIYVIDPDTNEVLFINDAMKRHYGIERGEGEICYKLFKQSENEMCDFCPRRKLDRETNETVVWEERSTLTKRYYLITDRFIHWPDGRRVHMQQRVDVTDMKKTQEELENNNLRLNLLLDSMNIALWDRFIDPELEIAAGVNKIWWSDEFRKMLGFTDENDFPNTLSSWLDRVHPDDLETTLDIVKAHLNDASGKTPYDVVNRLKLKNGQYRWFHSFGTTLRDAAGNPLRVAGATEDINEKRHTKEILVRRDKLLNTINEMAVTFLSHENKIFDDVMSDGIKPIAKAMDLNRVAVYRLFDKSGQMGQIYLWMNGNTVVLDEELVVLPDVPPVRRWLEVLKRGEYVHNRVGDVDADQAEFMSLFGIKSILFVPIFTRGEFWGVITMENLVKDEYFDEDCLDLMRSAAHLCASAFVRNENECEIAEKNDLSSIMLNNSPVGLTLFDEDYKFIDCNEAVLKIFGVTKEFYKDFFGSPAHSPEYQPDGSNSREKAFDIIKRVINGENIKTEWMHSTPQGEPVPVELTMTRTKQGNRYIGLGYIYDLREKNKLKTEIENALHEAKEANRAKSAFLANMSHEMRTPMNAIIGMTSIGRNTDDIEQKNHALNKIGDASSHLLGVINDVLDMAKIEADKLELSPVEYNFERMLQRVTAVINFRVEEKRQRLSVKVDGSIPRFVVGDDQRLAQVVTNLLSNAVKFTPEEGEIRLEASLIGEENGICEIKVEVTDNGIGISPEKQPKLFFAFEQAESGTSREYGGTGLGLAISRRIVELMGGLIWVESEIDKGAKFIFTVKAERSDKSSHSMLAPDVNWKNIRIMAVDDDEETLAQFRNIFNQLKIPCDTASGGYEAFRIVEERGVYDIYFIDWLMPGMDGIELTRRIKAMKGGKPSVVTMITAADWESIKGKAIEAGVDKHLLKPLFSSMIIDCVNECLGAEESPVAGCKPDNFKGKTMLLAEDIEINREILISLLEDTEITIDCAENGREALEKIAAEPDKYDVVLMDVQMPQMDGLESTRRIRALPELQNRKLPIIAMTANVFKSDIAACIEAGMDDHLGKPLDIDKVLEKLRKYMSY